MVGGLCARGTRVYTGDRQQSSCTMPRFGAHLWGIQLKSRSRRDCRRGVGVLASGPCCHRSEPRMSPAVLSLPATSWESVLGKRGPADTRGDRGGRPPGLWPAGLCVCRGGRFVSRRQRPRPCELTPGRQCAGLCEGRGASGIAGSRGPRTEHRGQRDPFIYP